MFRLPLLVGVVALGACTAEVSLLDPAVLGASQSDAGEGEPEWDGGELEQGPDGGVRDGGLQEGGEAHEADGGSPPDAGPVVPPCVKVDAGYPRFTGATHSLASGQSLKALLATVQAGDRVLVADGTYPNETLDQRFASDVFIEAAPGASPLFAGLRMSQARHLVFRGLRFNDTVYMTRSEHIRFDAVDIDVGTRDVSALNINNNSGPVTVADSRIVGGARTVFMSGPFGPSTGWNHDLLFVRNEFVCGSHNCFQLSGARDTVIDGNDFHHPKGDGILTAGATRITITRNRMLGDKAVPVSAVRLATPGMQWDNYAGVENMITEDCTVANNVIRSWGRAGIETDAARNIRVVNNTVVDTVGFKTWYRVPTAQNGDVILTGSTGITLQNNLFPSIQVQSPDPMPALVTNVVDANLAYSPSAPDEPLASGPAVDAATSNALTPLGDLDGRPRGKAPDIGAVEVGAPTCR